MRHRRTITQLVAVALVLGSVSCGSSGPVPCERDALTFRAIAELTSFSDWVRANGVSGMIGEVGWPDGPDISRWNVLAGRWYTEANADSLGVFAWSGAERWPVTYPLAIYRRGSPDGSRPVTFVVGPQAAVVEGHPPPAGSAGGVSLADGSFGTSWKDGMVYSAAATGVYGVDYSYPSADLLRLLLSRGVHQVRLAITWERLQPVPVAALDPAAVDQLRAVLAAAAATGVTVVLDLHNYGRFARGAGAARQVLTLGSPQLPARDLADFWRRLTVAVHDEPAVHGFGVMDEPHDLPGGAGTWEAISAEVVAAIRETNRDSTVFVGGYSYSSAARWTSEHSRPWISPTLWPVVYEAHQYFDSTSEGIYAQSYAAEDSVARAAGWTSCSAPTARS